MVHELNDKLLEGRIDKIHQPEGDEILFQIRAKGQNHRLLLSSNSSYPRIHLLKSIKKENPVSAPMFCMVLRKHLQGGKITNISQPDFERIVKIEIESLNEMGDKSAKTLIIEIMGKHSNIILVDAQSIILDSIKHISFNTSSLRQILPGIPYVTAPSQNKFNPKNLDGLSSLNLDGIGNLNIQKAIYQSYQGISPAMATEITNRAQLDTDRNISSLKESEKDHLIKCLSDIMSDVLTGKFFPEIILNPQGQPAAFSVIPSQFIPEDSKKHYETISEMLEEYYAAKDSINRNKQKSQDLRKLIGNLIERCVKKSDLQNRTLEEIADRDNFRLMGELIIGNIHSVTQGATQFAALNFYTENPEEIIIPLDANKSISENAQIYFKKYNKQKRTYEALLGQIDENREDLEYLEGIMLSMDYCIHDADFNQIRQELTESGFLKRKKQNTDNNNRKQAKKNKNVRTNAKPLHYRSSDGYDIYIGKNNAQNDYLTTKFAQNSDIWFHTKNIPGSHVILQSKGGTVSETALNEAAHLAAYYSKGRSSSLVSVDYCPKKNVKKPNGAKPGMVIYEKYKTAYVTPNETIIKALEAL